MTLARAWHLIGAALLLLASSGPGWAQTVIVRAGEHADFTRVVFNVPERMEVAITYRDGGIDLQFDRRDLQFETDTVFDFIPTTRLTALDVQTETGTPEIEADAGLSTVRLSLDCRCDIQIDWAGDRAFVVDIRDETALSAALFPGPEDASSTKPPRDAADFFPDPLPAILGPVPAGPSEVEQAKANPVAQSDTSLNLLSDFGQPSVGSVAFLLADAQDRQQSLLSTPAPQPTEYSERLNESQDAILQQIGRAATQGLLEPRTSTLPDLPEPDSPSNEPQPTPENQTGTVQTTRDGVGPLNPNTVQANPQRNMTISAATSMDQAMSERLNIALGEGQTPGCMNPQRVDAAAWAKDERFISQIGDLRSAILGEFDEPSPAAIKKLAQFYIHFGFGAEAKQVMTMLPAEKTPDPVLLAMINILEHGHDGQTSALAGYMDCDPLVAVWSLLSYEKVPGNEPIDPDGIVRGILNFPVHLRAHLGPIVGEKLRVAGYPNSADHIARALLRNEDTTSTAAAFLDTMTDATGPDARPSEASLEEVVADNSQPSPEALLKLIDARLSEDALMSEDMALLAGAFATELRDVPMGQDMARAYILSLGASGAFDDAFAELTRLSNSAPVPRNGTLSDLLGLLADKATDPVFLTHTIAAAPSTRFKLDDTVGNALAARLLSLGFPDQASTFVEPMAQGAAERSRKLIRAEIALKINRPRQAELEVLGESGDDVMAIIARARSMAGEHGAAQDIFTGINAAEDAERQAFLGGDWNALQTSSDPAIAAVADRQIAPDVEEQDQVQQVLARNSAMIEDSQSMRAEIEALLSGITMPEMDTETDP
ncbi:MAG: hypothetical protein AAFZ04_06620 [Pseudomonadota bacterium]